MLIKKQNQNVLVPLFPWVVFLGFPLGSLLVPEMCHPALPRLKGPPPVFVNACQTQGNVLVLFGEDTGWYLSLEQTWMKFVEMHIRDTLSNGAGAGVLCRLAGGSGVLWRLDSPALLQAGPGPHAYLRGARGRPRR